jgi:hypothetical protein
MRGKKGFLRILEAFIAIMIIGGVLAFVYIGQVRGPQQEDYVYQLLRLSLQEISNNEELRQKVLNIQTNEDNVYDVSSSDSNVQVIANSIDSIIPEDYVFKFKICELDSACGLQNLPDKEVISQEVSVSSTLDNFSPRKIRIFVWKK